MDIDLDWFVDPSGSLLATIAHWAFYYIMVHKKSKNLKNGHFLQSRTKIVLIKMKFAKFWHIGGWCAPVCLIDTLKNLGFL